MGRTIGVIGDTHFPFEKYGYLEWVQQTFKEWGVDEVVHIGDLIDHHAISFHKSETDAYSPTEEMKLALSKVKELGERFPKMRVCKGNHDKLPERLLKEIGLPRDWLRGIDEVYGFPPGWHIAEQFILDDVLYTHLKTGINGARNMAKEERRSVVVGHAHSQGKVDYLTNRADETIFGMYVGCGVDRESFAMRYGKAGPAPQLGCGIVRSSVEAYFVPWNGK